MNPVSVQTLIDSDNNTAGPTRITRLRGAVLMVLGPLLSLGMLAVLVSIGPQLWSGQAPAAGAASTGTRTQDLAALGLLVAVAVLGALFTWGGWNLWQRGRLGRTVVVPAAVLVAGLLAAMPWLKQLFV